MTVKEGVIVRYDGQTIKEFTKEQIEAIVFEATKNPEAKKVMLGCYDADIRNVSYNRAAGTEYTFYQLDNWGDILSLVNDSGDEMWKINKEFLYQQLMQHKSIYFSHDPTNPIGESFPREVQFIKEIIATLFNKQAQFQKEGTLWKLTW